MGKPLVAVFSGAGMSTDSGIPDYRGPQGLWRREPDAEKLVTYAYYMADPEIRRRSWLMRAELGALGARPNAAHLAVAELERGGTPVRVITQNVDGLHQLAGMPARKVFELHGTARSVVCTACHARSAMDGALARVAAGEPDPACLRCGGILKAATVMFGERLDPQVLGQAMAVAKGCQVFVAVGIDAPGAARRLAGRDGGGGRGPADHRERRGDPVRPARRRGDPRADRDRAARAPGPDLGRTGNGLGTP